jgi:short-subunit dehydrogenase
MNKLIVVTGGTKGIGRAILEKFAANHFDIVTCSRSASDLENLSISFKKTYPKTSVYVFMADMAQQAEVTAFTTFVSGLARPVDVLVNNAGYFVPGEICTEPDGVLEDMIQANLYSAYYTTRGIVNGMKERKAGHIFNICSVASIKAYPNGGSYAIAKHAMLGFSKCLREELMEDGIRVTSVMPGATKTASWENTDLPDSRFMTSEDVAETVFGAHTLSNRSVVEEIVLRPLLGDI